jgi:hypothetical protein
MAILIFVSLRSQARVWIPPGQWFPGGSLSPHLPTPVPRELNLEPRNKSTLVTTKDQSGAGQSDA